MKNCAIRVENLSKEYALGSAKERHESFRELLSGALTSPLRNLRRLRRTGSDEQRFWALRDLYFNVEQGEVLGIIGPNGAGKSTLLKVLSRITAPTIGRVVCRGRVASLLEVGTGFHPELTGRENIYLNGAILGMSRSEVSRNFPAIVEFAEVEKFLDTPVKRFSSGMYVRLAFSVAAHLDADTIFVDEVLAVGDREFQDRCLGKMEDLATSGRTVLFVSHNLNAIQRLSTKGLLLAEGRAKYFGRVEDAVACYLSNSQPLTSGSNLLELRGPLARVLRFHHVCVSNHGSTDCALLADKPLEIVLSGDCDESFDDLEITLGIFHRGLRIASAHDSPPRTAIRQGLLRSRFVIAEGQLRPGQYSVGVGARRPGKSAWCWSRDAARFELADANQDYSAERDEGVISLKYSAHRNQEGN